MNKDKIEYISHLTIAVIGIVLLAYVCIKYLLVLFLPFIIAWGVAFSIRPLAKKLSSGTKIPYKAVSVSLTVIIVIGGLSVVISAITYAAGEAWEFISGLAENDELHAFLLKIMNPISGFLGDMEGAEELEEQLGKAIQNMLSSVLGSIVGGITGFVKSIPSVLIFILVTVVGAVYFSLDLEGVNSYIAEKLPQPVTKWLVNFKNKFLSTLLKYLRSYLIIMVITFIVMLFGFLLLNIKYAVLFAFVVALLDALPLIGVGTVLVPWSIYQLVFGNIGLGIGLIILFAVHQIIRQFIEPKIVGKSLGIHPILSLVLLYVGYCVFGLLGLFFVPFFTVVLALFKRNGEAEDS